MKKKGSFVTGIMVLMVTLMTISAWAVPQLINYQGTLTDADGNPLDGSYVITFYIYDAASARGELWHEEQTVVVGDGIYSVQLGAVIPFPAYLFHSDDLYLEVVIHNPDTGSDEILTPRQRLISTAFAMKAGDAETLNGYESSDFLSSMEPSSMEANTPLVVLSITNTGDGDALSGSASGSSAKGVYGAAKVLAPVGGDKRFVVELGGHYVLANGMTPCNSATNYTAYGGWIGAGFEWLP